MINYNNKENKFNNITSKKLVPVYDNDNIKKKKSQIMAFLAQMFECKGKFNSNKMPSNKQETN